MLRVHYLRSLDVAEPCSPDVDVWVRLKSNITDFGPDVLALPIAVGPDEENLRIPGLGFDVLRYRFLVLRLLA
jgi:hypothetical protein